MTDLHANQIRNLETARRFFELMHRKDIDGWGELWADNSRIIVFYLATASTARLRSWPPSKRCSATSNLSNPS